MEIKNDPDTIYDYTIATNAIAIITDGSALPI
jgi:malic enzyme